MANVIQTVPDGSVCATIGICCTNDDPKCIFLDRGHYFQRDCGSGFNCRRYPDWELAIRHDGEAFQIQKCPPCLKETEKENA